MPFQKGVKPTGNKKGTKWGEGKKSNTSMDTHNYQYKKWEKGSLKRTFDIDEVDYYLYNDLDITELMDDKKLPAYEWKNGNKQYNLNSEAKKKRDENM